MTKISNLYALTNFIDVNNSGNIILLAASSGFTLDVNGTSRYTGAATFSSSVTATNYIATGGNNTTVFNSTSATTGWVQMAMNNTSGSSLLGVEGSTAGTLATGTSAYASVLRNYTNTDFQIATNNTVRFTISGAGAATFTGRVVAGNSMFLGEVISGFSTIESTSGNGIWLRPAGASSPTGLRITTTGAATFSNNITANGFIYTNGNLATANGNQTPNAISATLFLGNRGTFTSPDVGVATIQALSTGTFWYSGTALTFSTNPGPDVTGTNPVERMRITSGGNMLIATTSDVGGRLQVNGDIRAYGSFFRETGNITVNNSWTNVFTINTASQRTYLLQIIATNSEASLSYRYFGVIQGNPASSSYTSVSLASQTMEVQLSGATIQTRLTNSNQFNFNWSITQLL